MPETLPLVKFIASFAIIVIGMYALYYYLNRFNKIKAKGSEIQIKEMQPLGKNRFLVLADIKENTFLLAVDEQGIKVLKEFQGKGQ